MKVVINRCYGGFGLSQKAYEWLIAQGVPVQEYIEQVYDPKTDLYEEEPRNEGEVIFDDATSTRQFTGIFGRYWDTWTREARTHPLIIGVVEALGEEANGLHADLVVVEIPDDTDYTIEEYDGLEHIAETHRTWG